MNDSKPSFLSNDSLICLDFYNASSFGGAYSTRFTDTPLIPLISCDFKNMNYVRK